MPFLYWPSLLYSVRFTSTAFFPGKASCHWAALGANCTELLQNDISISHYQGLFNVQGPVTKETSASSLIVRRVIHSVHNPGTKESGGKVIAPHCVQTTHPAATLCSDHTPSCNTVFRPHTQLQHCVQTRHRAAKSCSDHTPSCNTVFRPHTQLQQSEVKRDSSRDRESEGGEWRVKGEWLSLIHISEPTRRA